MLRKVSAPGLPGNAQGYSVFTAANDGWFTGASPFRGRVPLNGISRASTLKRPGGNFRMLADRLFINPKAWVPTASDVLSAGEYAEGFAVYLYAGEKLVLPVTSETDLLPEAQQASRGQSPVMWRTRVSLVSEVTGKVVDGMTELSLSADGPSTLPELLPLNDAGVSLAAAKGAARYCIETRGFDGQGKVFTLALDCKGKDPGDYEMRFTEFAAGLPEGWKVVVDDCERGYSTDLSATDGLYRVYVRPRSTALYRVIVGDAAFVARNARPEAPKAFALAQNFPNPFNPATTLKYAIPEYGPRVTGSRVTLDVYSINGRLLRRLVDDAANPGYRTVRFNGKNTDGRVLASGLYVYRIQVKDQGGRLVFDLTRKMSLMK
jgi:hypothetical protein